MEEITLRRKPKYNYEFIKEADTNDMILWIQSVEANGTREEKKVIAWLLKEDIYNFRRV